MSVKMKIKVTRQILIDSRLCGAKDDEEVPSNCAIALAVRQLFPDAFVGARYIDPFYHSEEISHAGHIVLPIAAQNFITEFDSYTMIQRLRMPHLEFEVDIPDVIINALPLPDISKLIKDSRTLELV